MASPRAQPADELVAISDECDKRIVDVLDWALISARSRRASLAAVR